MLNVLTGSVLPSTDKICKPTGNKQILRQYNVFAFIHLLQVVTQICAAPFKVVIFVSQCITKACKVLMSPTRVICFLKIIKTQILFFFNTSYPQRPLCLNILNLVRLNYVYIYCYQEFNSYIVWVLAFLTNNHPSYAMTQMHDR